MTDKLGYRTHDSPIQGVHPSFTVNRDTTPWQQSDALTRGGS